MIILKMMADQPNIPDHDPRKEHMLLFAHTVRFSRDMFPAVMYVRHEPDSEEVCYQVTGTVYSMQGNKTVSTFKPDAIKPFEKRTNSDIYYPIDMFEPFIRGMMKVCKTTDAEDFSAMMADEMAEVNKQNTWVHLHFYRSTYGALNHLILQVVFEDTSDRPYPQYASFHVNPDRIMFGGWGETKHRLSDIQTLVSASVTCTDGDPFLTELLAAGEAEYAQTSVKTTEKVEEENLPPPLNWTRINVEHLGHLMESWRATAPVQITGLVEANHRFAAITQKMPPNRAFEYVCVQRSQGGAITYQILFRQYPTNTNFHVEISLAWNRAGEYYINDIRLYHGDSYAFGDDFGRDFSVSQLDDDHRVVRAVQRVFAEAVAVE